MPNPYSQILDLLEAGERRNFLLMMLLILVMSLFEVAGVAIILPFLAVVADPSQIETNRALAWLHDLRDPSDTQTFLVELGFLVFAVIMLGALVKIGTMYAIDRFSLMRGHHISSRLFEAYLRQPYPWFLNQNASILSKTILNEVNRAVGIFIVPAMRLIAQVITLILLVALLIYVDPVAALSAAAFIGVFYGGIYLAVQGPLQRMGHVTVETTTARYKTVGEALQGIKEVKLLGLERLYAAQYRGPSRKLAQALISSRFLGEFPRLALEGVAFGGIILMVLLFLVRGDGTLQDILPVLGMFVLAALRILAATQIIYNALTQIRSGQPVLDLIHTDVMLLRKAPPLDADVGDTRLGLTQALELRGVTYRYPNVERTAIDGLDLVIPARTRVGIVGGTGAGKTTVVDLILGLLEPEGGQILVDGQPLGRGTMRAWRNSLGYVPQQIYLSDDTIAANIAFGVPADRIDRDAVIRAAKVAELHDFVTSELEHGYDQEVGDRGIRLSGGQRQRIGIARALYHDPDVLILDEATSALDNLTEAAVMDAVNNLDGAKTIIMIAHRLTTVQACDTILLMEQGRIVDQGAYADLVARNETFRRMAREV